MTDVLVIEDDALSRDFVERCVVERGLVVKSCPDGDEASKILDLESPRLVITDLKQNGADGVDILKKVQSKHPETDVIVVTGDDGDEDAIECLKHGAFDFLVRPVSKIRLEAMVDRVLERQDLIAETKTLRRRAASPSIDEEIISKSIQMQSVLELVRAVADTDSTVLIRGESGTGKELVASEIHKSSRRASGPLVCVNCGALPEALLESELFGHEKGAFTWAIAQKPGMFELAGGGTIFLDEIGELSPALQVKLLRVLETRKFTRAGGSKMIDVNVRVICATNRDLEKARADGHFRGDLFYMLNVVEIKICPLRERTNDIPPLADKILRTISASTGIQPKPISAGAWECIMRFHWPGNVRELQNVLERSLIVCKGDEIQTADLPDYIVDGAGLNNPEPGSLRPLVTIECEYVRQAVKICGGNKSRAAKLLGIDRGTLARKLRG